MKNMYALFFSLFFLFVQSPPNFAQNTYSLIPVPAILEPQAGVFTLSPSTDIGIPTNNDAVKNIAQRLAGLLKNATGYTFNLRENSPNSTIQLTVLAKTDTRLGAEGYQLQVQKDRIILQANQAAGLFYGIHTLIQLLPATIENKVLVKQNNWEIPCVNISDYPRFGWRGIMLDVSRHFFSKEYVKQFIDQLAKYKFNVFHWHLTDDEGWRIEIKSFPKLTEVGAWRVVRNGYWGQREEPKPEEKATYGGFYTQDDIREIVKYAQERYITILPEIDVPGHSLAAVAAYPNLSCTKNTQTRVNPGSKMADWYADGSFKMLKDNNLNPSDEKVYQFLDKIFTEIAALFPGKYIHMGGDECYKGYWEQSAECQAFMKKMKLKDAHELQSYFVRRVGKIIESKGKKMIGWDEILEGGLAPNAAVMSWQGIKGGIEAVKQKHPVVMSPQPFCYIDLYQSDPAVEAPTRSMARLKDTYHFEPIPEGIDSTYILGGQGNLWSEHLPNTRKAEYMTYPRAWAIAEMLWSPKHRRNWQDFARRTEAHFERFDQAEIAYARSMYDAIIKVTKNDAGKLIVELSTEIEGLDIHYSMDISLPDKYYPRYTQAIEIPEGTAMFRVITYRDGKAIGKMISIEVKDLAKRAKK